MQLWERRKNKVFNITLLSYVKLLVFWGCLDSRVVFCTWLWISVHSAAPWDVSLGLAESITSTLFTILIDLFHRHFYYLSFEFVKQKIENNIILADSGQNVKLLVFHFLPKYCFSLSSTTGSAYVRFWRIRCTLTRQNRARTCPRSVARFKPEVHPRRS